MDLTISPQVRLLALVGVLAIAGMGVFLLTRNDSNSGSPAAVQPASKAPTATPKAKPQTASRSAGPSTLPVQSPSSSLPSARSSRLPVPVAEALASNAVVVVALYAPGSAVDDDAVKEAEAGSALGHAGFVALNVFHEPHARRLVQGLDVNSDPTVLVLRGSGEVAFRSEGFVDREVVAQAAQNAAQ